MSDFDCALARMTEQDADLWFTGLSNADIAADSDVMAVTFE